MKKHFNGFTILEIIIVIGIISLLLVTLRSSFQYSQRDFLYAESCINKVYGDANNFVYSAITSRGLYISGTTYFPEQYIIRFNSSSDSISLEYKNSNGTIGTYIQDILNGTGLKNSYCSSANYTSNISGDNAVVTINKGTNQNTNTPTFTLSGGKNLFTGGTSFFLCYSGGICNELAMFEIDTRTQNIKKKKCLTRNDISGMCTKRDQ